VKKLILVANWKNHPDSLSRVEDLINGLKKKAEVYKKLSTFIAPPLAYFESVSKKTKSFSSLASQDISVGKKTTTGAVEVDILQNFGVKLAIIGHSERRALGETNEEVSEKIITALKAGIIPLVCVGEAERDREGEFLEFIRHQIRLSLSGIKKKDEAKSIMIAYEPVWAIGKSSKDAVGPEDLTQMIIFIRKVLSDLYGRETADKIPLLYGGSVEKENAESLVRTGINGFLVGHESLHAENFQKIALALLNK
jgi:triosephosphate isomerase